MTHILYRLGETCSHVAAVITCLIRAAELQSSSGDSACTSQKCSWLPTAQDVSKPATRTCITLLLMPSQRIG